MRGFRAKAAVSFRPCRLAHLPHAFVDELARRCVNVRPVGRIKAFARIPANEVGDGMCGLVHLTVTLGEP